MNRRWFDVGNDYLKCIRGAISRTVGGCAGDEMRALLEETSGRRNANDVGGTIIRRCHIKIHLCAAQAGIITCGNHCRRLNLWRFEVQHGDCETALKRIAERIERGDDIGCGAHRKKCAARVKEIRAGDKRWVTDSQSERHRRPTQSRSVRDYEIRWTSYHWRSTAAEPGNFPVHDQIHRPQFIVIGVSCAEPEAYGAAGMVTGIIA